MSPSINIDLGYFAHTKTDRLTSMLGKGADLLPIRLWIYTARHYPESGKLTGQSTHAVETAIAWWGKRGRAMEALLASGFLEKQGADFAVHDWADWQPHIVKYARIQRERRPKGRSPPVIHNTNRQLDFFSVDKLKKKQLLHCIDNLNLKEEERIVDNSEAAEKRPLTPEEAKKYFAKLHEEIDRWRLGPVSVYRNNRYQIKSG